MAKIMGRPAMPPDCIGSLIWTALSRRGANGGAEYGCFRYCGIVDPLRTRLLNHADSSSEGPGGVPVSSPMRNTLWFFFII